jgi:hypothetical protein
LNVRRSNGSTAAGSGQREIAEDSMRGSIGLASPEPISSPVWLESSIPDRCDGMEALMATAMEKAAAQAGARPTPLPRQFRLVDMMILVAAAALGCGIVQGFSALTDGEYSWRNFFEAARELPRYFGSEGWIWPTSDLIWMVGALASPFIAMLTLALIPIRLLGPRPRWRRLARQPGMMAAFASALAIALIDLPFLGIRLLTLEENVWPKFDVEEYAFITIMSISLAILVSWMTLFVGRRWCAERSWVDRLGRAVGVGWISMGLLSVALVVLTLLSGDRPLPPYTPATPRMGPPVAP